MLVAGTGHNGTACIVSVRKERLVVIIIEFDCKVLAYLAERWRRRNFRERDERDLEIRLADLFVTGISLFTP